MNIKKTFALVGSFLLLRASLCRQRQKPNVVVIYVDDMGIGDIGCYGGKVCSYPQY